DFSEIGEPPDWLNDVPPEDEEALERDEDDDDDVEESQALLDELGELPAGVDVNARGQLRAYLAGLNSAYLMRPRKVPNKHADNAETWLLGFDDFHNRRADGRLPLWLS